MDQEGGGTSAIDQLPEALAEKMVTAADIQLAFRRLFRSRIRLGMVQQKAQQCVCNYRAGDDTQSWG